MFIFFWGACAGTIATATQDYFEGTAILLFLAVVLYPLNLCITFNCEAYRMTKSLVKASQAREAIRNMQQARPILKFSVECHHQINANSLRKEDITYSASAEFRYI
mmetsp:Transcript_3417/g.2397  ORF Transcript_3417/g.2397 Transcript_3417/m.2397 type:complete len:106 (+) Transcript_3417:557-874(+)